jgi:hypothetical protein
LHNRLIRERVVFKAAAKLPQLAAVLPTQQK